MGLLTSRAISMASSHPKLAITIVYDNRTYLTHAISSPNPFDNGFSKILLTSLGSTALEQIKIAAARMGTLNEAILTSKTNLVVDFRYIECATPGRHAKDNRNSVDYLVQLNRRTEDRKHWLIAVRRRMR